MVWAEPRHLSLDIENDNDYTEDVICYGPSHRATPREKYQSQIYFVVLMRTYLNKRNFFPFHSLIR